ncbi:MAG: porin [Adhaeribacter sp.]
MKKKPLLLSLLIAFTSFQVAAQHTDSVTVTTTPEATPATGALSINGYVDAYYFNNFNNPQSGLNRGRIFDLPTNTFSLGLVQTMFTYTYGKSKVVADLTYGPNADLGNFGNYRSLNTNQDNITSSSFAIKQAYLSYNITDKLAFTIGQYGTHIGYELIDAPLNFNYSLSYLFGNGPFYHTGAKFDYAVNDKLGLMVGVVNGWDMLMDLNKQKSVTAQVHLAPVEGFHIYANYIGGDEHDGKSYFGTIKGSRTNLWDLTTSFQASDKVKFGVNAAYGAYSTGAKVVDDTDPYSEDATWKGGAVYLNFAASDKFGLGFRAERFEDPSGVRYFGPFKGNEFTLTGDIKLADGHFNLKPELRIDTAKDKYFEDTNGNLTKKSQVTIGAAFIYTFDFTPGK